MNEHRKKLLEEQRKIFEEKADTISKRMRYENPASTTYLDLENEHTNLCDKLNKIETELSEFKGSSLTNNQRGNIFKKKLPNIDFSKSEKTINKILNIGNRDGVSAFFIIENIGSNRGDLLIRRTHNSLTKELDDKSDQTYHYHHIKHFQINLLDNYITNEETLLDVIAQFIPNTKKDENLDNYASNIIDTLEGSLQTGSIIFFELDCWDALGENQDSLLSWFVKNFWTPLTRKHNQISQKYANVKILIFMTTGSSFSQKMKTLPYFCTPYQFCPQKIVELSLEEKWEKSDISDWIEDTYQYSRQEGRKESTKIFDLSQGDPIKTCLFLERRFSKMA
ncbi:MULTISPECIES: hypothetical protein [Cyanophyceae]|uniref:hypothetical protein n=1 Tax=Cyanophyceae TaxID=3028117 RepID=UPI002330887D|nr:MULTISPECIES: hypothetical protein [Cyanophyceae]MDB9358059.1 hypothetical protein [Nodularia spumigena CS-587/03]MDB9339967.1 hypothetical protein [Nodularia spumigena CS-589/07]MDB9342939.1 hypothetical protein [Nodularia spumigena CS-588/06]MDB9369042.1 hypothetical protein [Nodularia spumigena CS-586/05]MDB9399503.1 hypothetical protein [Microcystis aeruginosa CS-567/02-A1]